ncbi:MULTISPECIES: hypothetical protein [unclassified Bartonella]|uniref:hypothetical protein n=2 Tax=Bartonella TaxID=773 RepID=UPI0035D103BB
MNENYLRRNQNASYEGFKSKAIATLETSKYHDDIGLHHKRNNELLKLSHFQRREHLISFYI